ncbi:helix-turn-helix domain-containing protein [Aquimarina brevivitae]|uniref:Helix-turn-helix protein n=1 Tax=Aquimarina brevivitae TaxID=323412 RepID=A0A4Q7P599_9FLAO|nr:helix-turn-helix transcriptional regulator [Aquimarina brevivitae]RZS93892.1 helix-turn-helix protein [Aquimarina brevivitae]
MNSVRSKVIAEVVKSRRVALGLTQQEVADLTKLSLRSVQRIEKGEVVPRMHTLKMLAQQLDFSLENLDESNAKPQKFSNQMLFTGLLLFLEVVAWAFWHSLLFIPKLLLSC